MAWHRTSLCTNGGILAIALVSLASCGGGGGAGPGGGGDGGNRHIRTITPPAGTRGVASPRFSPDGTLLAYARGTGTGDVFELAVMTAAGADSRTVASDGNDLLCMVWAADSGLIYGSADTGMRTAQLSGGPSQFLFDTPDALNPDLSPDGRWLAYGVYDGHLHLADLSQSPPVLTDLGFFADSPRFSPDGATLALITFPKIQLFDLASRTFTEVTTTDNPLGRVDWFPDGTRLLAGTERGIEIITLGPPVQRQVIEGPISASHTATRDVDLSPDATSIAFAREGGSELFVLTGF